MAVRGSERRGKGREQAEGGKGRRQKWKNERMKELKNEGMVEFEDLKMEKFENDGI